MSNTLRGSRRGSDAPFVMHLERVCRLIDMGAKFRVIEVNPNCDLERVRHSLIKDVGLQIRDGGDVSAILLDGSIVCGFGLSLANYKKVWRAWQNGVPTEAQRRAVRWG